ncbi:hypothetical protein ACFZAM_31385 [Streptomyces sp. NPDC008079]|uniref:hypothetical protein n=1 Tax=Streptomyces sp. NPDC008079 TaxID=3364806 RepID=UPI0036EC6A82
MPISTPVYLGPIGGAPQTWPILINPAVVNLWTDTPLRVTLQAALPGGVTVTQTGVDIAPSPPTDIRSDRVLRIGSTSGLDGSAILSISPTGTASWGVVDALTYHRHRGDSQDSTMVGMTDYTDIYPRQVWIGSAPGATSDSQGSDTVAIGSTATAQGARAVAIGSATALASGVAIGSGAAAAVQAVALGSGASASATRQVALGEAANASAGAAGAVAVGATVASGMGSDVTVVDGVKTMPDGSVVLGKGTMPSLVGLGGTTFVTLLGTTVLDQYVSARADASVAGSASPLGFYGAAGTPRPIVSSSGLTGAAGEAATRSLIAALNALGLIYSTDGALDDELAAWTLTDTHDANSSLDTGDPSGFFASDLTRAKRAAAGVATFSYRRATDIKDFTARVFSTAPVDITTEVLVATSTNGTVWTPLTLAWQALVPTAGTWVQTWCTNARPLPSGVRYLRFTLGVNASVSAPQIGRVIIR